MCSPHLYSRPPNTSAHRRLRYSAIPLPALSALLRHSALPPLPHLTANPASSVTVANLVFPPEPRQGGGGGSDTTTDSQHRHGGCWGPFEHRIRRSMSYIRISRHGNRQRRGTTRTHTVDDDPGHLFDEPWV